MFEVCLSMRQRGDCVQVSKFNCIGLLVCVFMPVCACTLKKIRVKLPEPSSDIPKFRSISSVKDPKQPLNCSSSKFLPERVQVCLRENSF